MGITKGQIGEPTFLLGLLTGTLEKLFSGAEMTQRQLYHQNSLQYGWQLMKTGILECSTQATGSSVVGRGMLFPGSCTGPSSSSALYFI